jgi:hypothetical protein
LFQRTSLLFQIFFSSSTSGTENKGFIKPTTDNLDMVWKWNSYTTMSKKTIVCDFCFHPSTGGITRAKKHQLWKHHFRLILIAWHFIFILELVYALF